MYNNAFIGVLNKYNNAFKSFYLSLYIFATHGDK